MSALNRGWPRPRNPSAATKRAQQFTVDSLERWYAERGDRDLSKPPRDAAGGAKTCVVPRCAGYTRNRYCADHFPAVVS